MKNILSNFEKKTNNLLLIVMFLVLCGCSAIKFYAYTDTILLTDEPVILNNKWVVIKPTNLLDILGHAPNFRITVNKKMNLNLNYIKYKELISDDIDKTLEGFEGELISSNGDIVKFDHAYDISLADSEFIEILIFPSKQISEKNRKIKYDTVRLRSKVTLAQAYVYWTNSSK